MESKMRKVLYHPQIEPDLNWLKKMLMTTDEIVRIVPHDLLGNESAAFKEFCDTVEGVVSVVKPMHHDIKVETTEIARLDKIFQGIAVSSQKPTENTIVSFAPVEGGYEMSGYMLLHKSKFTDQTKNLLDRHNLIKHDLGPVMEDLGYIGFDVVEERAGNLIMSLMADKIASREGWDTITHNSLEYVVTNLSAIDKPAQERKQHLVAECLLEVSFPNSLTIINPKRYKELRDSYKDIRFLYQQVSQTIAEDSRLGSTPNQQNIQDYMSEVTSEFVREMDAYNKSAYARKFGRIGRTYFCQLVSLAADGIKVIDSDPSMNLDLEKKIVVTVGAWTINYLSRYLISKAPKEKPKEQLIRRLCTLEKAAKRRPLFTNLF